MQISGKTKICAIIGCPVEHSLSPSMHNAAFQALNLDFVYVAFKVKRQELKEAIEGIRSLGIKGLNVTMPHKNEVIEHLDKLDPSAQSISAVNTILNQEDTLMGYNTDGLGAIKALKKTGLSLRGKTLLLLGAGGAGKAIAFQAAKEVKELIILNRTPKKAKFLADVLCRKFGKKIHGHNLSRKNTKNHLAEADILINATSVGMPPDEGRSLVDPNWLRPDLKVMDIIYHPIETKLVKDAKSIGAQVITGVDMLLYQGAISFEIWTGNSAPVEVMREATMKELSKQGVSH
ncbi:MAG: shikimate dehydrogenase [Thermoproteota archaeon]